MRISTELLIAAGIAPTQAREFAHLLDEVLPRYNITSPARVAAFIAQAAHESAGFTRLEENLYYTSPERILAVFPSRVRGYADAAKLVHNPQALASRVYANRLGNGDEASGDGWWFRGRGLFQLTGRENYTAAARAIGRPYIAQPELVGEPLDAVLTAAWYWRSRDLNDLADRGRFDEITLRINGPAMLGAAERRTVYNELTEALA